MAAPIRAGTQSVPLLWNHLDITALANTPVEDLARLRQQVQRGLRQVGRRPAVTQGFLSYTSLS